METLYTRCASLKTQLHGINYIDPFRSAVVMVV